MKNILITITMFLIVILIIMCENPFATREAEPPDTNQSSWRFPADPAIVLSNLESSFREKNAENYMVSLVDSNYLFRFTPDEYEASNSAGIFEHWSLAFEQNYINKIFTSIPDDSIISLNFSLDYQRIDFADSVLIRSDYTIELHHILSDSYPGKAKGQADFWFNQRNGYWVINRWEDHETIVDSTAVRFPSWSSVKASFVN